MNDNFYKHLEYKLYKNEERFRTIFEQLPYGIALIDSLTGHIYEVNQKFADIAGRTIVELHTIEWITITHPDDLQEQLDNMDLLNAGKINGFEMNKRYLHANGSIIWIHMTITCLKDNDKEYLQHLCIIEDITVQKHLANVFLENEERFKTLTQTTMEGFWVVDIDGHIMEINDAYCRMSGYSKSELLSMCIADLECNELTEQDREYIESIKANGWGRFERRHRKADGTIYKVQFSVIFLEAKMVFLCFINDITDRKQAEEEKENIANELKERVQELAFQSEEKADRAAELIIANEELTFQSKEKEKRAAELIIANEELAFQNEEKDKRAAELIIANKELAFQSEEKDKRAAELIIANKELAFQNKEKGRRAMQNDVLKEQNIELEMQKKQLDEASQLKSAFLSNMSHELRTPLNAIVGFSELTLKTNLNQKQYNYLSKIKISSHILLGLISDILDLSKIEAGKLELEIKTFNLEEVLQRAVNQISTKSQEKGLELVVFIDEGVPINLKGDSLRLGQILLNLASNAVKFTDGGKIVIRAELLENNGDMVLLKFSVKDTGIGLTEKQIKKLFQPFTQADASTTRKYGGTGLGLSISQELVNLMNGNIWVESELGLGSTFFFTININVADKELFLYSNNTFEKSGMKVLLVSDEVVSRKFIKNMLADMSLDVIISDSGEEAIAILENTKKKSPYELVIMDLKMQGMEGLETSRRIKTLFEPGKSPAIILLTAYHKEVQEKSEEIGLIQGVLYKPVNPSLLFNAIMHICNKEVFEQISTDSEKKNDKEYVPKLRGSRVLLVEDNEINMEVAREMLLEAGMIVTMANNGREAVDKVKNNTYDIVLMDIQMPIMDGYDATMEIRKAPIYADLPIIAMTANALISDQEKCLQAGMNDHVAKPIDTTELFQKITYWINKGQATIHKKVTIDMPKSCSSIKEALPMDNGIIPSIVGIDVQIGLSRLGGNKELYFKLLIMFYENHKHAIKKIRYSIERGDVKAAKILVHNIKGAGGNLGARDIYLEASAIEAELNNNSLHYTEMLLVQLEKSLDKILTAISLMKKDIGDDIQNSQTGGVDIALIKPLLDKLEKLLVHNNMDAVGCVEEIVKGSKNMSFAENIIGIKNYVAQYDFEGALDILNKIFHSIGEE
ncbi:response regulator [Clostridium tagluense]|uniref:hybrid sensor histidine kinase/response regulator n=1 Tax=Clostridium tagluense TaxID=360422 RepID=UPI001CF1E2C4|nr:response regulator [Clostridium tagluense]MCB2309707.1 response regulator [Clostridium tagluense]MCB2314763.1 response regulator [Clostridium tagluense]MCB2319612.1 response regulator [Clostridium tagluense]MCB2324301.1 response regulator [Clostridium tagluense]MCB2329152.1 response regulator [Clostridium tagluense]